jgi:hypothetical protein
MSVSISLISGSPERAEISPCIDFVGQRNARILLQSNEIRIARHRNNEPLDGLVDTDRVWQVVPDTLGILPVAGLPGGS